MAWLRYTETIKETVQRWDGEYSSPSKHNQSLRHGIPVLENQFLEKYFSNAPAIGPGLWFGPLIAAGFWYTFTHVENPWWLSALTIFAGYLGWTLFEYWVHRLYLHRVPPEDFSKKRDQFMVHGYHHEFPNDKGRLVAPPIFSFPLAVVFLSAFYFIFGLHSFAFSTGYVLGYLAYDWIHYYTHHFTPKNPIGRFLRRYHLEHHYKDADSHFGISCPIWDVVFNTYRSKVDIQEAKAKRRARAENAKAA